MRSHPWRAGGVTVVSTFRAKPGWNDCQAFAIASCAFDAAPTGTRTICASFSGGERITIVPLRRSDHSFGIVSVKPEIVSEVSAAIGPAAAGGAGDAAGVAVCVRPGKGAAKQRIARRLRYFFTLSPFQ